MGSGPQQGSDVGPVAGSVGGAWTSSGHRTSNGSEQRGSERGTPGRVCDGAVRVP
jgi:hypothetical protein